MADKSAIEWTDATWNPTVGCSIVSPGCANCYAMKVANGLERRFDSPKYRGLTKVVKGNAVWTGEVRLDEAALLQPLKWKKGRRIFVNSMSDLFHESLSDHAIERVFSVMIRCPQHRFQILTKRAERMSIFIQRYMAAQREVLAWFLKRTDAEGVPVDFPIWPLKNVWLGVSAERQEEWDERSEHLRNTPAAVKFLSAEPLLAGIRFHPCRHCNHTGNVIHWPCPSCKGRRFEIPDWVIVGGESGKDARPMHPDWARSLRDQCATAGVPFFFKQWGEHAPQYSFGDGAGDSGFGDVPEFDGFARVGKKAAGRLLDGVTHDGFPEVRSCS